MSKIVVCKTANAHPAKQQFLILFIDGKSRACDSVVELAGAIREEFPTSGPRFIKNDAAVDIIQMKGAVMELVKLSPAEMRDLARALRG